VAGSLDIEPAIEGIMRDAARRSGLVRRLAWAAVALRPTGFFRDFVLGSEGARTGTLDVKHGGIVPITNLARTFAIDAGASTTRTIDRLRAAAAIGRIDADMAVGLEEGFRLLWRIRLEHQVRQCGNGAAPDDDVDPHVLGVLTRRSLKEAFRLISAAQRILTTTMGLRPR
jgi:CBS domain-containing protein